MDKSFWLDRPVFVTGGTGLLGSWLVKKLVELKAAVVCIVRDWVPQSELVRNNLMEQVNVVRGDIRDQALIERILGEYEITTVFHLAAQTIVTIANRNPISTFETNIGGTWMLLEACRHSPLVKQIVMASSDKAYGDSPSLPYTEDMPLQGRHPYDVSKSCGDLVTQAYATTYNLPVAITRNANLFGGGDLNWNRIIPGTIRSIIRQQRPVIRSDGKYIRDYFYIEDSVAANIMLAEKIAGSKELAGEAFNFTYERHLNVLELTNIIIRLMDTDLEPVILNEADSEIREQYLSGEKARRMLGWKPLFTIEEGLDQTIRWYRTLLEGQ
jgi:CDP-glucose 4,6-dehydratase